MKSILWRRNSFVVLVLMAVLGMGARVANCGTYSGGTGEPNDPYLIYDANQMNAIGANPGDWGKHFKLMADIDLSRYTGTAFNIIGNNWTPFTGVFDGNDHKILNFSYSSTQTDCYGLFRVVGVTNGVEGEIRNLTLVNPIINAPAGLRVGSLVARIYNGTISNCCAMGGRVLGGDFGVGGLIGIMEYGSITNSYSTCDVFGSDSCYVTGGLLGSIWRGTISYCFATGNVSGYRGVGGLMAGTNEATVSNCYAMGDVSGMENVGRLLGEIWDKKAYIYNCYSTGEVSGSIGVGGLIGTRYSGTVFKSFWDKQTSGRTWSAGGTGKTTAEMQTESTFTDAGWDFNTPIWTIDEGVDYPRLWWERCPMPPIEVSMKFTPQALNPDSKGNWVKAHFALPEEYTVDDVDTNTPAVIEPFGIESDYVNAFVNEVNLVEVEAAFDRSALCAAALDDNPVELTVVGRFANGQYFYGTDTVKIINNNLKYLAVLSSYWLEANCAAPDWCGGVDLDQNTVVDFVDFALFDGCCIEIIKE